MPWLKNRATHYHAKLEQTDEGSVIKKFFFLQQFSGRPKKYASFKSAKAKNTKILFINA